ncbi:MAG: hypothetical protein ACQGVC_24865 [Myxococcota bacterium]
MRWYATPRSALTLLLLASAQLIVSAAWAGDIRRVRQDCTQFANCSTTLAGALGSVWAHASPTNPVALDVGPGFWDEAFSCPAGEGNVSVRGSGVDNTVIRGDGTGPAGTATGCTNLSFSDLTFESAEYGFRWVGGGDATWSNVDIVSVEGGTESAAFVSTGCEPGDPVANHTFFGSRLIVVDADGSASPVTAWLGNCSDGRFYGGEMRIELRESRAAPTMTVVTLNEKASLDVFGTALRAIVAGGSVGTIGFFYGVQVGDATNAFSHHGGIISLSGQGAGPLWTVGISSSGGGVRTGETAYALLPGAGGSAIRIAGENPSTPFQQSPFLWQAGTSPPPLVAGNDGEDLFVETDCESNGDCGNPDPPSPLEPHLMVMNPRLCGTTDPWFDMVTGQCRVLVNP